MNTIQEKELILRKRFAPLKDPMARYQAIIEAGKKLSSLPQEERTLERKVQGCQSQMYLKASFENGVMIYQADSDALISKGLAAILIEIYSGQTPEAILKHPPQFLEDLGISTSLSLSRANGLASLYQMIKQKALKEFLKTQAKSQVDAPHR